MNGKKLNKIVSSAIENAINSDKQVDFEICETAFHIQRYGFYDTENINPLNMTLQMWYDIPRHVYGARPKIDPKTFAKVLLFGLSETNFYNFNKCVYHVTNVEFVDGLNRIEIIVSPIMEN